MNLKAYSVRDKKGGFYGTPFFTRSHGEAERAFANLTDDPKSQVHKYPEDFSLHYIGQFNDQEGTFDSEVTPQFIADATPKTAVGPNPSLL